MAPETPFSLLANNSEAMKECLINPDAEGTPQPAEVEKLFLSLA